MGFVYKQEFYEVILNDAIRNFVIFMSITLISPCVTENVFSLFHIRKKIP